MVTLEQVLKLVEKKAELGVFEKIDWCDLIDEKKDEKNTKDLEKN